MSLPNINDEFEEEDDEGNKEFTIDPLDDLNSQIYETDESSNEPDDFLQPVKHHRLVIPDDDEDNDTNNINGNYYSRNVVDEESGSGSDSDSSKSDIYVRVGGRFRKEKNALKGVLPESAKDYRYINQVLKGHQIDTCRSHKQFWSIEKEWH